KLHSFPSTPLSGTALKPRNFSARYRIRVVPAKAGTHMPLDSRLRGNDEGTDDRCAGGSSKTRFGSAGRSSAVTTPKSQVSKRIKKDRLSEPQASFRSFPFWHLTFWEPLEEGRRCAVAFLCLLSLAKQRK
ncbi:MAG TPA: hypothetical protein VF798_16175, partial [Burkholderiaceae bacterium]